MKEQFTEAAQMARNIYAKTLNLTGSEASGNWDVIRYFTIFRLATILKSEMGMSRNRSALTGCSWRETGR